MGGLPDDVLRFVERHFSPDSLDRVCELLTSAEVRTPRVMRSVLYLSNGSVKLLEYFIEACRRDLREILIAAEYVIGVADEPMPVRDMSLPFEHEGNLGEDHCTRPLADIRQRRDPHGPNRVNATTRRSHHAYLVKRRFALGEATYTVAGEQPYRTYVRCYRQTGRISSVVRLPLLFVLEHLAEHIELEATGF